jgi:hypothetical protein
VKVAIQIKYEVNAEGDETQADENRMMEAVSELVGVLANQIIDAGRSEGLTVRVENA